MSKKGMGKSLLAFLAVLAIAVAIAIYMAQPKGEETFDGTILEITEKTIIVEPFKGEKVRKYGKEICVRTDGAVISGQEDLKELEVGQEVKVLYSKLRKTQGRVETELAFRVTPL